MSSPHFETTFREAGVDYETGTCFGVLVPARTPPPVVRRLHAEIAAIVQTDEVGASIASQGAEPVAGTPDHFAEFIAAESKRWAAALRNTAARPQ